MGSWAGSSILAPDPGAEGVGAGLAAQSPARDAGGGKYSGAGIGELGLLREGLEAPPSPFIAASSALICATMRLSIFFIFLYGRYSVLHSGTWFSSMSFPNPTMAVKEARARWRALATTEMEGICPS